MMAGDIESNQPVEVFSMARRLCFEERVRIEAMAQAAVGAAEAARRLGRHPVTVQRELGRNGGPGGYDAEAAQAGSCARAARPKAPKLARRRRAGRRGVRAPRPALVAAGDQRRSWGPGPAGVRGDHLPGVGKLYRWLQLIGHDGR